MKNFSKKIKKFQRSPGLFFFDMHLVQVILARFSEKKQRKLRKLILHPRNFFRDIKFIRLFLSQNNPPRKNIKRSKKQKPSAPIALDFRFFQDWSKKEVSEESPILFFWGPSTIAHNVARTFPEWRVLSPAPGITWPRCWQLLSEYLAQDEHDPVRFLLWTPEENYDAKYFAQNNKIPLFYISPGLLGGFPCKQGVFLSCFINTTDDFADKSLLPLQMISAKDTNLLDEARRIMDIMRFLRITGLPATDRLPKFLIKGTKQIVLVLGSRLSKDSSEDRCALELAQKEYPHAEIIYIPYIQKEITVSNDEFAFLLDQTVHVYTFDSLLGMDALIRQKPLTVLGQPIYAGYGLTDDRDIKITRKKTFSLEELFVYIYFEKQIYIYQGPQEEACLTAILFMAYKRWMQQWEGTPQPATGEEEVTVNVNWQRVFSPLQLKSLVIHKGDNVLQYLPLCRLLEGQHWEFSYIVGCYLIGQLKSFVMVPTLVNQLRDILPKQAFHALERTIFVSGVVESLAFPKEGEVAQPENYKIVNIHEPTKIPTYIEPAKYDFFIKQAQIAYAKRNLKESWQLCATLLVSGCASPSIFDLLVSIYYLVMDFPTSVTIYSYYINFEKHWRIPSYHLHGMQSALHAGKKEVAWRAFLCYLGLSQQLPSIIPYINGMNKMHNIRSLLKASLGLYSAGKPKNKLDLSVSYLNNCCSDQTINLLQFYHPAKKDISLYIQSYCRALLLKNRNEEAYSVFNKYINQISTPANFNFLIFCIANSTCDTKAVNHYYKLSQRKGIELNDSTKHRICAVNSMFREFFYYYGKGIYNAWKKILPEDSFIKSLKGDSSHQEAVVLMGYSIGETCFFAGQLRNLANYYSQHLHFVCDARLFPLLHRTYPDLSFIPTARMYRFSTEMNHLQEFSQLPRLDLAAIMTNEVIPHWQRTNCLVWIYNLFADMIREQSVVPRNDFLICDPTMVQTWKKKLAKIGNKIRVAICWRSALKFVDTQNYIFTLEELKPLLEEERIQLIDCQYTGLTEEEKTFLDTHYPGKLLSFAELDLHDDLDGTAAMLSQVDCVISIPNSLGTQAAALGKHTYLLSSCQPGYFLEEENSGHSYFLPHAELVYPDSGEGKQSVARKIRDRILAQYSNN